MENRSVLITGASSGIGYEFAKIFAKQNNNLILVARNRERLEEIRAELIGNDIDITLIEIDLTQQNAAEEVYNKVKGQNKRIDVLINNAGIGLYGKFDELNLQKQLTMMELNMVAVTQLTYLCLKDMIEQQFGRILNVGSISSFISTPYMTVYAATKAYVLSFTESLGSELKRNGDILVTALCPGPTKTNFSKAANMGKLEKLFNRIAMSPAIVAEAGYKALEKGKPIKMPGKLNSIMSTTTRFLPRKWIQKLALSISN